MNSVFNVILPFNNCDSIPPLRLRSQGINPGSPAIQGLISPRKATLRGAAFLLTPPAARSHIWVKRRGESLLLRVTHLPPLLQLILTRGTGALGVLHINGVSSSWDEIKRCVSGPRLCAGLTCLLTGFDVKGDVFIFPYSQPACWGDATCWAIFCFLTFHFSWHL